MSGSPEQKPRRGRPRSQKARDAVLASARDLLLAHGYSQLSVEGVAANAGVGKATIYRWWPTKGELVLDAAHDDIAIGTVPESGDPVRDVEAAIDQLIATFSHPVASIVIFAAIASGDKDPRMARIFREQYVYPWRQSAAEALARASGAATDGNGDVQFLLDVIVGTVFQRTLVLKEPNTAGLKKRLIALILPSRKRRRGRDGGQSA